MGSESNDRLNKQDSLEDLKSFDPSKLDDSDKELYLSITDGRYSIPRVLVVKAFSGDGEAANMIAELIDYQTRNLYDYDDDYYSHPDEIEDCHAMLRKSADLGYGPAREKLEQLLAESGSSSDDEASELSASSSEEYEWDFDSYGLGNLSEKEKKYFSRIMDEYSTVSLSDMIGAFKGDGESAYRVAADIENEYEYAHSSRDDSDAVMQDAYEFYQRSASLGYGPAAEWLSVFDPDHEETDVSDDAQAPDETLSDSVLNSAFSGGFGTLNRHDFEMYTRIRDGYGFVPAALLTDAFNGDAKAAYDVAVLIENEAKAAEEAGDPQRARSLRGDAHSMYEISSDRGYAPAQEIVPPLSSEELRPLFADEDVLLDFEKLLRSKRFPREQLLNAVLGTDDNAAADAFTIAGEIEKTLIGQYRDVAGSLFCMAAKRGHVPAYSRAAHYYFDGYQVPADTDTALGWLRKGADLGDPGSLFSLAELTLDDEELWPKIPEDTVDLYLRAAEKGSAEAMYALYELYEDDTLPDLKGRRPLRDCRKAREWLLKAKDAGYEFEDEDDFDYLLECLDTEIEDEEEEDKDPRVADIRKKAYTGDVKAQIRLGEFYRSVAAARDDYSLAEYWLSEAAESGDAQALYELSKCIRKDPHSRYPVDKDTDLLKKSSENGYPAAMYEMGLHYLTDFSFDSPFNRDEKKAAELFLKAADKGFVPAQYQLGCCYIEGVGVEKSLDKAIEWLTKANEHSDGDPASVTPEQISEKLKEAQAAKKEDRQVSASLFWDDHKMQIFGILAALGVLLFKALYVGLGAALFYQPDQAIQIQGLARFLLLVLSVAGIFYCTFVAVSFAGMYIGLEGLLAYPSMFAALFILAIKKYPIVDKISLIAAGVIVAIHVIAIIADKRS